VQDINKSEGSEAAPAFATIASEQAAASPPLPRAVYTVKAGTLQTTTARSALHIAPYDSPDKDRLYPSLRAAQRAALRMAREEADDEDQDVRILFVVGRIQGRDSVEVYEVETIELEPDEADGDELE
jgi:hypothetical protein